MEDKDNKLIVEEHNASFDEDPILEDISEDELQDAILEDSGMNGFQKWIARLDEKKWTLLQRIVGAILGVATGVSLFWNGGSDNEQGFSWSLIIAVVIAMLIPNILEKQGQRRIPKLRVALVIALGVMIAGYFVYWGTAHGFRLTN